MSSKKWALAVAVFAIGAVVIFLRLMAPEDIDGGLSKSAVVDDAEAVAAIRRAAGDVPNSNAAESRPESSPVSDSAPADASRPESAPAAQSEPTGALRVKVVFARTKAPAAEHLVRVIAFGGDNPDFRARWTKTDREGEVLFPAVPVGGAAVEAFWGGDGARTKIKEAETVDVTLEIPAGCRVEGEVVSSKGEPVGHADVRLSSRFDMESGVVIARADGGGRFVLDDVDTTLWRVVGATHTQHAPSAGIFLSGKSGTTRHVRLVLGGPTAKVTGIVVGKDERPIADVVVSIGPVQSNQYVGPDGEQQISPAPFVVTTDSDGRFKVEGVPAAEQLVDVRALEYAPWSAKLEFSAGESRDLRIELESGVTVVGKVFDAKKTPLDRVEVELSGARTRLGLSRTVSRADGSYRLRGLPKGAIKLRAEKQNAGECVGEFVADAGQTIEWNPTLDAGLSIKLKISDADGKPVPNVFVEALVQTEGEWDAKFATSDAEGRAVLQAVRDRPYELSFRDPIGRSEVVMRMKAVRPGGEEIRVTLGADMFGTCTIRGRVLEPNGTPIGGARLTCGATLSRGSGIYSTDVGTGAFELKDRPPGEYHISVDEPRYAPFRKSFTMTIGQTFDFGDIVLTMPGYFEIAVDRSAVPRAGDLIAYAWSQSGGNTSLRISTELTRSGPLLPGTYNLTVSGPGIVTVSRDIDVRAGETTAVAVTAQIGGSIRMTIESEPNRPRVDRADVKIYLEGSSTPIAEMSINRYEDFPLRADSSHPPGSYRIEVSTPDGRRATQTAVIGEAGGTSPDTLVVVVE